IYTLSLHDALPISDAFKRGTSGETHGEEEFDREEQPAAEDGQERAGQAREAEGRHRRQEKADGGAVCRDAQARSTSAQLLADPHSQSLRADRPSALGLPQNETQPYRDARARFEGARSGPREVQPVREG